jgi:hypothetical protein
MIKSGAIKLGVVMVWISFMMQAQDIVIHVPVSQSRMLEVDAGQDRITDDPGTILLGEDMSVTGGTADYTYSWTDPGQVIHEGEKIAGTSFGTYFLLVSDQQHCTAADSVQIFNSTGLETYDQAAPVIFYPNPSEGTIQVDVNRYTGTIQVDLLDMTGKTIYQKQIVKPGSSGIETLHLGTLPEGGYLIRVSGDNVVHTGQILIN